MIRRLLALVCILALLCPAALARQDAYVEPCQVLPGESALVRYFLPATTTAQLSVTTENGLEVLQVLTPRLLLGGLHELKLDETFFDSLQEGSYLLVLTCEGVSVSAALTIGSLSEDDAQEGTKASDENFIDENNTEEAAPAAAAASDEPITPAHLSAYRPQHENCYWCTPMDITDEAAVWAMLIAPVTVVDLKQKEQLVLRAEPDNSSEGVGVITGQSQAVHVLEERSDGWVLVETYSSSFHDSRVKNWNAFVTGYVQKDKLKTVTPRTDYAMIVDKLTQRLYIFADGKLLTELLASTGLANERQPYNETRSGEFLIVSRVGDFKSDNLICRMGLRFNSGDLLHEVPHVLNADGTRSYKSCEPKLGQRASHGCIRIQRRQNADGINMYWIWNNIKTGTKLVVWEDYAGRQIPLPDDSTPLYYNPDGGSYYHSTDMCPGIRDAYLPLAGTFTYGQLEDSAYASLTMCPNCIPPLRKAEITQINEIHLTQSPGVIQ